MKTVTETDIRHYILNPAYALRGWKLLPYAVQNLYRPWTVFLKERDWELLQLCDGQTDIDWNSLPEEDQKWFSHTEEHQYILRCSGSQKLASVQEYRFYPARFKETVQWSITGKCNFRCKHCFMSAPHAAQGEPSFEQLMTMLDAFERCGIKGINLTGGEPLIRKDFWDLVDEILRRGMIIPVIFSNGLLVTDRFLDELEKRKICPQMQFSFDGVGFHDWMRGVEGAEKSVINALRRCRDRGIPTSVSMALFKENKDSIRETVKRMAELGCFGIKINNSSALGEWKNQPEHYLTQEEVYETFLEYIPHYFEDGKPLPIGLEGFFNYEGEEKGPASYQEKNIEEVYFGRVLMCGHVRRELYVSPKGNILPCMSMVGTPIEEQFPNMLETPLEEILDTKSLYMDITNLRISDFMEHNPECQACEYKAACCGGCRAIAVSDGNADYLAKDPVTCLYFKGGWKQKKDELLRRILTEEKA